MAWWLIGHLELSYAVNSVSIYGFSTWDSLGCSQTNSEIPQRCFTLWACIHPATPNQPLPIHAFSGADWKADPDDRRSTSGAAIYLVPNLVSWWTVVSQSNTMAEYRNLAASCSIYSLDTDLAQGTFSSSSYTYGSMWQS